MISGTELLKKSDIFAVSEDTDLKRICKIMEKRDSLSFVVGGISSL